MSELEKAARALLRLVEFELDENRERQPWKGKLDALRAALEAEAGWEDIDSVSLGQAEMFAVLMTDVDGDQVSTHKYRVQRRPLREMDDE